MLTPILLSLVLTPQADDARLVAKVEAIVDAALEEEGAVGLSVAVALGERVVLAGGYGLAEVEHDVPADRETLFRIGSITKQFTAAAIMQLAEAGKLGVDDPLTRYVEYPTQGREVTLRHLLTHTSGIPGYTEDKDFWRDTARDLTHDELLAYVRDEPFLFEPGQRFQYCNTGYYLLGMVIEQVTGEPYADVVRERFVEPLHLGRLRYGSADAIIPNRAQGYRLLDGELANDAPISMTQPGAAGALLATAESLVRWQLALAGGKVVSPASYEEMTTPFLLNDLTETSYGMGLFLGEVDGQRRVGHGGGINGFNSQLDLWPAAGLSVAVISNSEALSSGDVARRIAEALLD